MPPPKVLILGGTTEASALATRLSSSDVNGIFSYAGRVKRLIPQPLPTRVGGFGGAQGLAEYLGANDISHVIDATHPFATRMSHNAVAGCNIANVPLIALTRAPWERMPSDLWEHVPDVEAAAEALDRPSERIFLAIGRQNLDMFSRHPQHHYLLRVIETPDDSLMLKDFHAIIARGPFTEDADMHLLETHQIDRVVSKNSGGMAAYSKLAAARRLGLPVTMIDRPKMPRRKETHHIDELMNWLAHGGADRGV